MRLVQCEVNPYNTFIYFANLGIGCGDIVMANSLWKVYMRFEAVFAIFKAPIISVAAMILGWFQSLPLMNIFVGGVLAFAGSHYLFALAHRRILRWGITHQTKDLVRDWMMDNGYGVRFAPDVEIQGLEEPFENIQWRVEAQDTYENRFYIERISPLGIPALAVRYFWAYEHDPYKAIEKSPHGDELIFELNKEMERSGVWISRDAEEDPEIPVYWATQYLPLHEDLGQRDLVMAIMSLSRGYRIIDDSLHLLSKKAAALSQLPAPDISPYQPQIVSDTKPLNGSDSSPRAKHSEDGNDN
ncbi:MAG: hypothetical protein NPIRA05_19940 [Nitrospirales bacterium]|nr:MAG: hypothetical protein NPIRA05_19940 [Nitrospirales bacterium]